MTDLFRVEFECISAIAHPQLYDPRTDRARRDIDWDLIPESWWTKTHRDGEEESIRRQYVGLLELIDEGELIRNVRLLRAPEPQWEQVVETAPDEAVTS